jgi:hypothetical protein
VANWVRSTRPISGVVTRGVTGEIDATQSAGAVEPRDAVPVASWRGGSLGTDCLQTPDGRGRRSCWLPATRRCASFDRHGHGRCGYDQALLGAQPAQILPAEVLAAISTGVTQHGQFPDNRHDMLGRISISGGAMFLVQARAQTVECDRLGRLLVRTLAGGPTAQLLLERVAIVAICHSRTKDLAEIRRHAYVLVYQRGGLEWGKRPFVTGGSTRWISGCACGWHQPRNRMRGDTFR